VSHLDSLTGGGLLASNDLVGDEGRGAAGGSCGLEGVDVDGYASVMPVEVEYQPFSAGVLIL